MDDLWQEARPTRLGYREAGPALVARYLDRVRLVDVREPAELVGELGQVPGVELVPLATVRAHFERGDRGELLVLICRSGGRSGRAAEDLAAMGYERLINVTGGMLEWNELGLPLERPARAVAGGY